ncbi:MAG: hypothetical protein QXD23_04000 [Candidatus Micrarchaeaceae archaeon]
MIQIRKFLSFIIGIVSVIAYGFFYSGLFLTGLFIVVFAINAIGIKLTAFTSLHEILIPISVSVSSFIVFLITGNISRKLYQSKKLEKHIQ